MRKFARPLSLVLLPLVFVAQALPASAANTWSDTDPVVLITTPGGHVVSVYVDNGTNPADHIAAAQLAQMTYSVKSTNSGDATMVTLTSTVPCDASGSGWETRVIPSSAPFATGTVYGQALGTCGQPMTVQFKLPWS
jgi:hypothetical protein